MQYQNRYAPNSALKEIVAHIQMATIYETQRAETSQSHDTTETYPSDTSHTGHSTPPQYDASTSSSHPEHVPSQQSFDWTDAVCFAHDSPQSPTEDFDWTKMLNLPNL